MEKYSYELKKKIVEEYLSGKSSYRDLAMKYQIENLFLDYGWIITDILAMKGWWALEIIVAGESCF